MNRELVAQGYARVYRHYSNDAELLRLAAGAKQKGWELWADPDRVRHGDRYTKKVDEELAEGVEPVLLRKYAWRGAFAVFLFVVVSQVALSAERNLGDSPQFSTLNAHYAPKALVGSALTIVNCIGFSITIISIQLLSYVSHFIDTRWLFLLLIVGPVAGLYAMRPLLGAGAPRT